MMKFTRMLPSLLTRTDVVLEIRDSRLPLTSINRTLEGGVYSLWAFLAYVSSLLSFPVVTNYFFIIHFSYLQRVYF